MKINNDDDFQTPKPIKTVVKVQPKKKYAKRRITEKVPKRGQQTLKDHFKCNGDTNPVHLQMALALSKIENQNSLDGDTEESLSEIVVYPSTQQIQENAKRILEPFTFQRTRNNTDTNTTKLKRKPRQKLQTVSLLMRSDEDRQQLINKKVEQILGKSSTNVDNFIGKENIHNEKLFSCHLNEIKCKQKHLLKFNHLEVHEMQSEHFYLKSLNLNRDVLKCGSLLKRWEDIQGRELSPERVMCDIKSSDLECDFNTKPIEQNINCDLTSEQVLNRKEGKSPKKKCKTKLKLKVIDRCASPDLFSDEDEFTLSTAILPLKENTVNAVTESHLHETITNDSDDKESSYDNGICHFESFHECVDLTISSDDECESDIHVKNDNDFITAGTKESSDLNSEINFSVHSEEILNSDIDVSSNKETRNKSLARNVSINSIKSALSTVSSQDSVYISDEELNYSVLHSHTFSTDLQHIISDSDEESNEIPDEARIIDQSKSSERNEVNYQVDDIEDLFEEYETKLSALQDERQKASVEKSTSNDDINVSTNNYDINVSANNYDINVSTNNYDLSIPSPTQPKHARIKELQTQSTVYSLNNANSFLNADETPINLLKTPDKAVENSIMHDTPGNVIMKTAQVTPMPDYESMKTPEIGDALNRFGIKKLKRHRAIQMLKHIYETTHPILKRSRDDEIIEEINPKMKEVKRRKLNLESESTSNIPPIKNSLIEKQEDLFFERKQSKKIHSCSLPLQIAWHNLLGVNPEIHRSILLYEPLQVEVLYDMLKEQGHKYHIQDLITFLDKKCITIRIAQNQSVGQTKV